MTETVWDSRAVSGAAGIVADRGYDRIIDHAAYEWRIAT